MNARWKPILIIVSALAFIFLSRVSLTFCFVFYAIIPIYIFRLSRLRLFTNVIIVAALSIINDLAFKSVDWGSSDAEGTGWINAFFLFGNTLAFIVILIYVFAYCKIKYKEKIISLCVFVVVIALYIVYFAEFGMKYPNNPTNQITLAKNKKLFISEIVYSDSIFTHGNDTFRLGLGWIEQETQFNHTNFIKKTGEFTNNYIYEIPIKGKFNNHRVSSSIYYTSDKPSTNGASPIDTIVSIKAYKSINEPCICFYIIDSGEDKLLKCVKLRKK